MLLFVVLLVSLLNNYPGIVVIVNNNLLQDAAEYDYPIYSSQIGR